MRYLWAAPLILLTIVQAIEAYGFFRMMGVQLSSVAATLVSNYSQTDSTVSRMFSVGVFVLMSAVTYLTIYTQRRATPPPDFSVSDSASRTNESTYKRKCEEEIQKAQMVLRILSSPKGPLPVELALIVMEFAEYWPKQTTESRRSLAVGGPSGSKKTAVVLTSSPIVFSKRANAVRRITITIDSRDQGFSDLEQQYRGTRDASFSWFEAILLRPRPPPTVVNYSPVPNPATTDPPREAVTGESQPTLSLPIPRPRGSWADTTTSQPSHQPPPYHEDSPSNPGYRQIHWVELHRNIHAGRSFETEIRMFDVGHPLVDLAQEGDQIVVLALAQYPGWCNYVRSCKIEVDIMI